MKILPEMYLCTSKSPLNSLSHPDPGMFNIMLLLRDRAYSATLGMHVLQ